MLRFRLNADPVFAEGPHAQAEGDLGKKLQSRVTTPSASKSATESKTDAIAYLKGL